MLLRFGVQNHLSIKGAEELSLLASTLNDVETGLIECDATPDKRVLPAAVMYGSNASGKSNLVAAIRFFREAVLSSHRRGEPGGGVARTPFALDPACSDAPSIFDADLVVDGTRYHYGFEALDDRFGAEWLHAFPNNRRQLLFQRNEQDFRFGRVLKGRNRVIADLTRPNSLFLSAAAQNDHQQLSGVVGFFQSMRSDTKIAVEGGLVSMSLADDEMDARVIKFLERIGTGVVDYRRREKALAEEEQALRQEMISVFQKFTTISFDSFAEKDRSIIELAHRGRGGEPVFLDLDRESAGTRRLLLLLGHVFRALDAGSVLVVDELDASLHTKACEAIVALFSTPETNPKGAQLIATTHDTNLLGSPVLRRDQVWFTEKDNEGATHLYPLTDIRTRKGDNIEKGYLQGRYGAIAFSGPVHDLVSTS